jgi:heat-inducible transcriptional repressor
MGHKLFIETLQTNFSAWRFLNSTFPPCLAYILDEQTSTRQGLMMSSSIAHLDERSREIFRLLVDNYLATGETMSSRSLSRLLPHSLSPASIRNVLSDLENMGLLYAPHTSAGRLPTDFGLRFFVDALLQIGDLTAEDQRTIEAKMQASRRSDSIETVLTEASQTLSGLTLGAGVVLTSKNDSRLKHLEFVQLEPGKALAILVGDDGFVENRIITLPMDLPVSALIEATNYLNAHVIGKTLTEAITILESHRDEQMAELDRLTQELIDTGIASWSGTVDSQPRNLIVRGRSNLIGELKATTDIERVRLLFDDLENKNDLIQLLGFAEQGDGVRIFIGAESNLFSMSGSSLIVAPYKDSNQTIVGALGVIGPTRLNYARIIPRVDYTARVVSKIL